MQHVGLYKETNGRLELNGEYSDEHGSQSVVDDSTLCSPRWQVLLYIYIYIYIL